jgi:hypothetical protein
LSEYKTQQGWGGVVVWVKLKHLKTEPERERVILIRYKYFEEV